MIHQKVMTQRSYIIYNENRDSLIPQTEFVGMLS